ncbi:MAG TPA: glycerol kinase GlpK [Rugosimonospora sp.]|nr:glycerol kinase GlpK [Rugosimonospora sp.]
MTSRYIAAIDQGTTSTRCIVFDSDGRIAALDQREHRQIYPRPGWVEHDAMEIWHNVGMVTRAALDGAGLSRADLAAIGITNQRETTLLWDAETGEPVHNAIVWQDTRTDRIIRELAGDAGPDRFRPVCGLPLATYFAGPKIRWLLDSDPGLAKRAEAGEVLFGTLDTWLIWRLTGGQAPAGRSGPSASARHATDVTNASRTMLMSLSTLDWDADLLDAFGVPRAMLPEIRPSSYVYGEASGDLGGVPVASALGDQQAALFGQTCFDPGQAKCTYGTGSFLLLNTGTEPVPSERGLVTTLGYQIAGQPPVYALEGSIAVTGALVQWLRDNLGVIAAAAEVNELAAQVSDNGGCYFVPAFSGLFAPYWRPDARGVITGLTGYVTKAHLARAALEATAWQVKDVVDAMEAESHVPLAKLKVDGGMTASELLMQFQSDVLDVPVERPTVAETTALGAGYAAGLAVGFWPDLDALRGKWQVDAHWAPRMDPGERDHAYRMWHKAVERSMNWLDE